MSTDSYFRNRPRKTDGARFPPTAKTVIQAGTVGDSTDIPQKLRYEESVDSLTSSMKYGIFNESTTSLTGQMDDLARPQQVVSRGFSVEKNKLDIVKAMFPNYVFKLADNGPRHSHPILALNRIVGELEVVKIARRYGNLITDIGGNPDRHNMNGFDFIHCCCPVVEPKDVIRADRRAGAVNMCTHLANDCDIIPDVFMSVHSLYYLTPLQILELVHKARSKRLVALMHNFDMLYGQDPHGEYRWEYVDNNGIQLVMKVNGNMNPYVQPPMFWLKRQTFGARIGNKMRYMAWDAIPCGEQWIYTFAACEKVEPVPDIDLPLTTSLDRSDHFGSVTGLVTLNDGKSIKPAMEFLGLADKTIHSFGNMIWLSTKTTRTPILLPKGIIQEVALEMVGVERDAKGLQRCIATMKRRIAPHSLSIPVHIKLNLATYGSAMAFVHSLRDEVIAFNGILAGNFGMLRKLWRSAINLENFICCGVNPTETVQPICVTEYNLHQKSTFCDIFDARRWWPEGLPGYESPNLS